MNQPPERPTPGWYRDPTGVTRYWDGSAWGPAAPEQNVRPVPIMPARPYPTPPKKSSPLPLLAAMVGGFVLLVLFVAVSNTGDNTKKESRTSQEVARQPTQTVAPAGSVVRDGKFEFMVGKQGRSSADTLLSKPVGEWYVVEVGVVNIGDEQRSFYPGSQKLIDSQGREYQADTGAAYSMNDNATADLNPGLGAAFAVPFDVPVGMVPVAIELHDSMFSGGVRVALK